MTRTVGTLVFIGLTFVVTFAALAAASAAGQKWGGAGWAAVILGSMAGLTILRVCGGGAVAAIAGALKRPAVTKGSVSAHGGRRQ